MGAADFRGMLVVFTAFLASQGAWAAPALQWERLRAIVETNETELDLDGDGTIDLKRTFGANGRVLKSWQRFPDGTVHDYGETTDAVTRTSHWTFPDGSWKHVVETWWTDTAWSRREVLHGKRGGPATLRTVSVPDAPDIRTSRYRARAAAWELVATESRPMVNQLGIGTPGLPPPAAASSIHPCPYSSCHGNNSYCFQFADWGVSKLDKLSTVVPGECRDCEGRDLSLTNAFRVDLTTCGASEEALKWARDTSQDM
ncbi:MAG: hypothetical protein HY075_03160, partial [Deltaproteobacteria bacterium]|nr:hypothetical protein [Deltaproteobacteria bacterium]